MTKRTLAAVLAVLGLGASCGEAIDISRVGPNVVDKTIFTGEWYFRSTVVDKQFHTDMAFIGLEGGLERIQWEITESQLIATRSYERIQGTDPSNPGEQNILAIFPIRSHFDIRRGYNAVNGVETNVIEENTYDRPWWDRDFMRVDWHVNLAATWDLSGFQAGVNRNSNNDPKDPFRVRISPDYIETTLDVMQQADPWLCYYLDGVSPCNGSMVKTKMSFMKVPANNDYVPLNYPDFSQTEMGELVVKKDSPDEPEEPIFMSVPNTAGDFIPRSCMTEEVGPDRTGTFLVIRDAGVTRMCNTDPFFGDEPTDCEDVVAECVRMEKLLYAGGPEDVGFDCDPSIHDPDQCFQFTLPIFSRFGYFRTDRFVSDRENGVTLTSRERLINRWNIWRNSRDADGRPIPMALREPKPLVYHLNVLYPPEMIPAAEILEADWDTAFRSAVASAKGIRLSEVTQQMFEIKVNDCNVANVNSFASQHGLTDALRENGIDEVGYANLENACAVLEHATKEIKLSDPDSTVPTFTWQQLGDLRYSFLNWTPKPELAGPLGYGPSAADPVTGEIISANANMYGSSVDTYANWGADIVQLINGEISEGDVINGTNVREHIEAVRNRWSPTMPDAQVKGFQRLFDERTGLSSIDRGGLLSGTLMADEQYLRPVPLTAINANLDRIAESGIEEAVLVDSEAIRMFGNDFQAMDEGRITDEMIERAKPSNWARHAIPQEAVFAVNGAREGEELDSTNMTPSDRRLLNAGTKVDELADYLGRKNFCFLAQQVEPAIADLAAQLKDENLTREQIVQRIREQVFIGVAAHELGHTFGLRHNFEGSADAMNFFPDFWGVDESGLDPEKHHLLAKNGAHPSQLRYSSIMDYHQRFNSDFAGIGLYDKAAIKFGYAEMAEVFDETDGGSDDLFVARGWINDLFIMNPYDIPRILGGRNADEEIDADYNDTIERYFDGDDTASMDMDRTNIVPRPNNIYRRKDIPYRDFMRNELYRAFIGDIDDQELLQDAGFLDDDGRIPKVAVPYSFCSDAYAWGGSLTCNRYDMGITSQEIVNNAGEMYEFYYPFNAFRRDRVLSPFFPWQYSYVNRLYSRTYQPMLNSFRFFYYYRRSSLRVFPSVNDWASASLTGMNFFARVLQTPDVGTYCKDGNGAYQPERSVGDGPCDEPVTLGIDQGRFYNSSWDAQYFYEPVNVGSYWDKLYALLAMTDSNAFFFRDFSSFTNRGAFSIGYYRVFQPEMLDLFGSVMAGDLSTYSARVVRNPDGTGTVAYKPFLTTDVYGNPIDDPIPEVGDPIAPGTSYDLKNAAAFFGMVNLSSVLDQTMDFAQRSRITIKGSQSDPVVDTGVVDPNDIVDFLDPNTQNIYRAVAVDGQEVSIGFRLLNDAKTFSTGPWQTAKDALDAAEAGGDDAAIAAARTEFFIKDAELQNRIAVIDYVVWMGNILEYPN